MKGQITDQPSETPREQERTKPAPLNPDSPQARLEDAEREAAKVMTAEELMKLMVRGYL